jgi:hypothetical protein
MMNRYLEKEQLARLSVAFGEDMHLNRFVRDLADAHYVNTIEDVQPTAHKISDHWVVGSPQYIVQQLCEDRFHFVRFSLIDFYEHRANGFTQEVGALIHDFAILTVLAKQSFVTSVILSDFGQPVRFNNRFHFLNGVVETTVEFELSKLLEWHHQYFENIACAIRLVGDVVVGGPK